jgi:hypothetical protein
MVLSLALLLSVTTGLAAVDNRRRVVVAFRTMVLLVNRKTIV